MKRVGIYPRVSTNGQTTENAPHVPQKLLPGGFVAWHSAHTSDNSLKRFMRMSEFTRSWAVGKIFTPEI